MTLNVRQSTTDIVRETVCKLSNDSGCNVMVLTEQAVMLLDDDIVQHLENWQLVRYIPIVTVVEQ